MVIPVVSFFLIFVVFGFFPVWRGNAKWNGEIRQQKHKNKNRLGLLKMIGLVPTFFTQITQTSDSLLRNWVAETIFRQIGPSVLVELFELLWFINIPSIKSSSSRPQ